ncbi:MAG: hypothetical protein EBR12_01030, partial [Proteobacteria bacterium]|nr:hypothetical protein [Pseudomonadota bacterium]
MIAYKMQKFEHQTDRWIIRPGTCFTFTDNSYLSHALGCKAISAARLHISIFLERISVSAGSVLFSRLSVRQQGFLLMMLATFCFPTMDVMAKYLLQSQPVMQVVWARYTGQFLLILFLFAPRLKKIIITRYPRLQLARSAAL